MTLELIPADLRDLWEVHEWKHACAILAEDFPNEWGDLLALLTAFRLRRSWITVGGGNRSLVSREIDSFFYRRGWLERQFSTLVRVDQEEYPSPTHKVDCFKNRVALEIEWNNKDPLFRPRPEQFPSIIRAAGGVGRNYHHTLGRT